MKLRPFLDGDADLVASWLADPQISKWLYFGPEAGVPSALSLRIMRRRPQHALRLFTADDDGPPIGLVALSDIDRRAGTAMLWYLLGDGAHRGHGHTTRAVSRLLSAGFSELDLRAVSAWVADGNAASVRVLQHNGFKAVGRQRACHLLDGVPRDRLLFDLLLNEHKERA